MAVSLKRFMQQISGKKAPGPSTSFTIFHVFYALELLAQKPLGRNKLAEKLKVGDGAVRTIISRLREAGLIETSKAGCALTERGREVWSQFEQVFPRQGALSKSELSEYPCNYAVLVHNSSDKVKSGIDQRDAAIIAGAKKAFVMVYRTGHLSIKSVSDNIEQQYPEAAKQILEQLKPEENDAVVIASAESALRAKARCVCR